MLYNTLPVHEILFQYNFSCHIGFHFHLYVFSLSDLFLLHHVTGLDKILPRLHYVTL